MPKIYTKQHYTLANYRKHIAKIKSFGGEILFEENKKIKYHYPSTYINRKYTHFAVRKSDKKIIDAWDYTGYDNRELSSDMKIYFFNDLNDREIDKNSVVIWTKQTAMREKLLPFDTRFWAH